MNLTAAVHRMETSDRYMQTMLGLQNTSLNPRFVCGSLEAVFGAGWNARSDFTKARLIHDFLETAVQRWDSGEAKRWEANSSALAGLRRLADRMTACSDEWGKLAATIKAELDSLVIFESFAAFQDSAPSTLSSNEFDDAFLYFSRNRAYLLLGLPLGSSEEEIRSAESEVERRVAWLIGPLRRFNCFEGPDRSAWEYVKQGIRLLRA
jgi:hypothetical protein